MDRFAYCVTVFNRAVNLDKNIKLKLRYASPYFRRCNGVIVSIWQTRLSIYSSFIILSSKTFYSPAQEYV